MSQKRVALHYKMEPSAIFVTALWQHRTEFVDTNAEYRGNKGLAEIARWHWECDQNERFSTLHREGTARRVPSRVQSRANHRSGHETLVHRATARA
ncbi:MAG: hypothetical protein JWO48_2511 [Bryobacterales bacterium]|nr:hypothetical protein [Bryobacterales bacterium]